MRRLWILTVSAVLLLASTVTAHFLDVSEDDDEITAAIKSVQRTWDPSIGEIFDDSMFVPVEKSRPARKKRDLAEAVPAQLAAAFVPPNQFCDLPGYTGENCEFPICDRYNSFIPDPPKSPLLVGYAVDMGMMANCSMSMNTVLDSTLTEIHIEVSSDGSAQPSFTLFNSIGTQIGPSSISKETSNSYQAIFIPQPPGTYVIAVQALDPNFRCFVTVRALTDLMVVGGFVPYAETLPPERNDFPNNGDSYVGDPSTFVVHAKGLVHPGSLVSFSVMRDYNIVTRPQKLSIRYGCGYEYYQENFICRVSGSHLYRIEGIDFYGSKFRRLGAFTCILPVPTSPASGPTGTPDPGPTECSIHGRLVTNTDGTRYCMCLGLYMGRDCRFPMCLNGGTRQGPTTCMCAQGFTGNHCQDVKCTAPSGFGFGTSRPALIFIVRAKSSLKDIIVEAANQIKNIAYNMSLTDPEYLNKFGLVIFNNNALISEGGYNTAAEMVDALNSAAQKTSADGGCEDSVFSAVEAALGGGVYMRNRSPIYVITDAVPNDDTMEETIFQINSYWRTPIYVIFVEPPASSGCLFDEYAPGYRLLEDMTRKSSGQIFFVAKDKTPADVGSLVYSHLRYTIYHSNLIYSNDVEKCSNLAAFQPITVDIRLTELTVIATGKSLNLTITSPGGAIKIPDSTYILNDIYIWTVLFPAMGQFLFHIESAYASTPCSYRIYSDQFQLVGTPAAATITEYDIFWAFTPELQIDGPNQQPVYDKSESLVVHVNNYNLSDASRVFAELTVYHQTTAGRQALFLSNGLWRDGCDYQLYFAPFKCANADELLYFTVYIRDDIGFMIQRSGVAYCTYAHPTPYPPSGCQNGGLPLTTPDNSSACYCPPNWAGDSCQTRVCYNGGSLVVGAGSQRCVCPPGFSGDSCETVACIEEGPGEPYTPIGRDMVFVVELTTRAALSILRLVEYFPSLYKDLVAHHPEWIQNYILVAYNETWSGILAQCDRSNVDAFQSALSAAYQSLIGANMTSGCHVRVWHALDEALTLINLDGYINVFHVSAPEQSDLGLAESAILMATEKRILVNIFYSYVYASNGGILFCNQTLADYQLLEDLADTNGGRSYPIHQGQFLQTYHMIPNFYMSGLVYVRNFPDCELTTGTVYFPVDSYTQSIQINSFGYMNQIHVYRPDSSEFTDTYDILDDSDHAGWRVTEARRACDNGWMPIGMQQCALFLFQQFTWNQSRVECHTYGANLIDELEADRDTYLDINGGNQDFWIGLNDIDNDGRFVWDSPDGTAPVPFNGSLYSNWGPGEPSGDSSKRCVARLYKAGVQGGKWYTVACSDKHAFACEKHKFDQDMLPNEIGDVDLPSGKWYATVRAQQAPANHTWSVATPGCIVEVRVQSGIQVFPGFTLDMHGDVPDSEAVSGSTQNRFVTHLYGGEGTRPAILSYANIYDFNTLQMVEATTYQKRVGCSYPWLSQTFSCPDYTNPNNKYAVLHIGEDQYGLNFQRVTTGRCNPELVGCNNGGILYNGTCVCDSYWTGKRCQIPNCVNGGILDTITNASCICPQGYTGTACQFDQCLPMTPVPASAFTFDHKTFALVLEMTAPNNGAIGLLRSNILQLLEVLTATHPNWFYNYLAVTVNSTSVTDSFSRPDITSFANAIRALPDVTDPGASCGAPLFGAVARAMQDVNFVAQGSVLFLITRSTPTDSTTGLDAFLKGISEKKPQMNYMVVDDTEKVCGSDPDGAAVQELRNYAFTSGGNMFLIPVNNFITFLNLYLPTMYTSTLLSTPTLADMSCVDKRWFAQVDSQMNSIYIAVFADAGAIAVLDNRQRLVDLHVLYNVGKTRLLEVSTVTQPGIYTITMSAPANCMVQVRGDSPLTVYTAFAQPSEGDSGAHNDVATADPVASVSNIALVHLAGLKDMTTSVARLTYTELINPANNKVIVSQLYRRYNCSYEYYSRPFTCPGTSFLVMVNGVDDNGINFRREVAIAYCPQTVSSASLDLRDDFVDLRANYQL